MSYLDAVERELASIADAERLRTLESDAPKIFADFSSNDYLGLAADSRLVGALKQCKRVGAGGARLLGGRHREHFLLEQELARYVRRERALLFSSGYLAAIGAISVLTRFARVAYSDAFNHASLIDALRLSKIDREIYSHARFPAAAARRTPALVVTESIYGMDGDRADLRAMVESLRPDDVLLVDEAHALGVVGPHGSGLAADIRDERVVILGTLGKAFGAAGGFIAGPAPLIDLLVNAARTFIFDTALPPPIALAARVALTIVASGDDLRERLHARVEQLRTGMAKLGFPVPLNFAPIVPVILGSERRALDAARRCYELGAYVPAVRPPTVPAGSSRLRISVRADHTAAQVGTLLEALACIDIS